MTLFEVDSSFKSSIDSIIDTPALSSCSKCTLKLNLLLKSSFKLKKELEDSHWQKPIQDHQIICIEDLLIHWHSLKFC